MKPLSTKILGSRFDRRFILIGALYALIFVFFWLDAFASAALTPGTPVKKDNSKKIRITADKLITFIDAGEIEYIGNVRATRAKTVVTADRIKIIYTPSGTGGQTQAPKPESIEKIIAQGHVKIMHENIFAETDMAEYSMKSAILVLTGERSKVTQGGRSISGTKFTLYRSAGEITVESNGKNRVKAVFEPSKKDQ